MLAAEQPPTGLLAMTFLWEAQGSAAEQRAGGMIA